MAPVNAPLVDSLPDFTGKNLDNDNIVMSRLLGEGGFGKVYKALDVLRTCKYGSVDRPLFCAVKCLLYPTDPEDAYAKVVKNELALHTALCSHPNIVTIHRTFVDESQEHLFVVMDLAAGDLFDEIVVKGSFMDNDEKLRRAFLQILDAVKFCHDAGVAHGDIKPENILCDEDGENMLLTDFGLATRSRLDDSGQGSSFYMSPELVRRDSGQDDTLYSTTHCDIWALGVLLINFASKRNPWNLAEANDECFSQYLKDRNWLGKVLSISSGLNEILKRALHMNPLCRIPLPSFRQAILELNTFSKDKERALLASTVTRLIPLSNLAAASPRSSITEASPSSPSRIFGHHKHGKKSQKQHKDPGSKRSPIPKFVSKFFGSPKRSPRTEEVRILPSSARIDGLADDAGSPTASPSGSGSKAEGVDSELLETTVPVREVTVATIVPAMVKKHSDTSSLLPGDLVTGQQDEEDRLTVPRGSPAPSLSDGSSVLTATTNGSGQPITPPGGASRLPGSPATASVTIAGGEGVGSGLPGGRGSVDFWVNPAVDEVQQKLELVVVSRQDEQEEQQTRMKRDGLLVSQPGEGDHGMEVLNPNRTTSRGGVC